MRRLAAASCLLLAGACSGGGGSSSSAPPPPGPQDPGSGETRVSGASPFDGGCGGFGGILYRGSEVEPHLVADPRDPNHLVAAWQQDRWSNGASQGLLAAASFDGGASWTARPLAFSVCGGGTREQGSDYGRATDPWVAFGADGTVYAIGLSTSGTSFQPGSASAVLVSRSSDGGRTWSAAATLARDTDALFDDKETLTADPADARLVYATWDRVDAHAAGTSVFARSVDGGATWGPARVIHDPGPGAQTIGNLIRVLPDGTLVDLYVRLTGDEHRVTDSAVEAIRSTDRGATWSAPVRISAYRALGAADPASGRGIRDGSVLAQMAVAPDGSLDVVWQDARFTGLRDAIALSRSVDGGLTWSAPVRVNADPAIAAFTPQVHVRADGTIGVSYFVLPADRRDAGAVPVERRLAQSSDGSTWTEIAASAPFDLSSAPLAAGAWFLGDYMGLASAGADFLSLYARTTGSATDATDLYLARIAPPAGKRAAPYRAEPMPSAEPGGDFARRVLAHLAGTRASLRERSPASSRRGGERMR
ncbi:MAG TPA: sialidase family protein [Usitatibacter sp.]|nr:sialidase family protein [Usitatibacter sp.]